MDEGFDLVGLPTQLGRRWSDSGGVCYQKASAKHDQKQASEQGVSHERALNTSRVGDQHRHLHEIRPAYSGKRHFGGLATELIS